MTDPTEGVDDSGVSDVLDSLDDNTDVDDLLEEDAGETAADGGTASQSPSTDDRTSRSADGTEEDRCPTCERWFKSVTQHWAQSDCGYPDPTRDERAALVGIWLAGGFADHSNAGFEGTPRLQIYLPEDVAVPLNDLLGTWKGSVSHEQKAGGEKALFSTRYCPFVEQLKERDRRRADLSPRTGRTLFIARGARSGNRVAIRARSPEPVAAVLRKEGFDAEARTDSGTDLVAVSDGDEFIEYIGGPVSESVDVPRLHP